MQKVSTLRNVAEIGDKYLCRLGFHTNITCAPQIKIPFELLEKPVPFGWACNHCGVVYISKSRKLLGVTYWRDYRKDRD